MSISAMSHLRQSRATLSRDKGRAIKLQRATMKSHAATLSRVRVARQNRRCDMALKLSPVVEYFSTKMPAHRQSLDGVLSNT